MSVPAAMPLISRGCPAFTNDDFSGAFPANHANNSTYGGTNYWRCAQTPTANANSGTLIAPVYLAYDLSASAPLTTVLLHWDQSAVTGAYDCNLISNNPNNIPTSYTIDVNTAAGGTLPTTGWTTKATVTASEPYHSRQHLIDMTGCNWIRIDVTGITGSAANNNCALNMDVHNAPSGATDSWLCVGDSITQRGFMYDDTNGLSAVMPQQINTVLPNFYPVWEDAGVGGFTATDIQTVFSTWLAFFPGKFVMLNLGTNDANLGGAFVTNYASKMQNMITAALAASKTVVIPTIPWLNTTAQAQANVLTLNSQIATLIASNPGCIAGPDLYAFFSTHQSDISSDGLHPTDPALGQGNGYLDYRTQWVNWAQSSIYTASGSTITRRKHGVAQILP